MNSLMVAAVVEVILDFAAKASAQYCTNMYVELTN